MSAFVYLPDANIAINIGRITTVTFHDAGATVEFDVDQDPVEAITAKDAKALAAALGRAADYRDKCLMEGRAMQVGSDRTGEER